MAHELQLPPTTPALEAAGVSLRPAGERDERFLRGLYRELRWDEFGPLGWPDEQRASFIDTQFDYQRRHYRAAFPDLEHYVVEQGGAPIGQLQVDRGGRLGHLVDISLLPERRGQGIGAALLRLLQADARAGSGQGLRLDVEEGSPARRLYERLGFIDVPPEDDLPRASREMVWAPRCVVPEFDGASLFLSRQEEDALWQAFFTAAPARRRVFEPSSKRRKRAPGPLPLATG